MAGSRGIRPLAEADLAPLLRDDVRCRALLAATDAIVWTIDPHQGFIEPQPSWQAYTGQTWEQARGSGWRHAVHPDDEPSVVASWALAVRQGEQYHASCRIWHAGTRAYRQCVVRANAIRDASGRVVEWVGAVTDVHDRPLSLPELHRVNDALKAQLEAHQQELEQLFRVSLDIILTVDGDGRLITVSPSFEGVVGVPAAEARGQTLERFLHPDDVQSTRDEVHRVLTGEHNAIDFETRILRPDGGERVLSWRAVGSASESRLYAVGRDVTESKRAEQRLLRAERLEAVGQLTGGIAHDFNNILAAMHSFIELARRLPDDAERRAQALESAARAGRRGAALVSQLLTFARRQRLALAPTDVNAVATEIAQLLERTLGGLTRVELQLAPGLPPALTDPVQLGSMLMNLCINARDAMPAGGRLTIASAPHAIGADPATRRDELPPGDYVALSVTDTGSGMDEPTLARCFEPFFTTKASGHGTGLGLSQVLGVAQQCGGTVQVDSRPGLGTTVTVLLPRAPAADGHPQADARPAPAEVSAGTVLVVDDDQDVLASTAELLKAFGFDTLAASSAAEAMRVVLTATPFDVMLTDYAMPGASGVDLVKDAQRERPQLRAVIVTGMADTAPLREALPGVTILGKPFEPDALVAAVGNAVREHRLQEARGGEH